MRAWKQILFIAIAMLANGHAAWAACSTTCSSVTETTKLTFPTLEKPAAGSVNYTVAADGSGGSGTATVLYGTATRGAYVFVRDRASTTCTNVNYSVANVSSGNAGVTYSAWKIYTAANHNLPYSTNTGSEYPAQTPGSTWYIGATITITSSATTGSFSPSYDIVCTITP